MVTSIAAKSNGFVFAGNMLMNIHTKQALELEIYGHDPDLAHAFRLAAWRSLSEADVAAIDAHSFTLYVVGNGGSTESARGVMQAMTGLLHAGSIAAKVESAGVAHSAALCYRTAMANRCRTRIVSVHKSGTPRSPNVPQRRKATASRARSKRATL
jgi:hypothetical protein